MQRVGRMDQIAGIQSLILNDGLARGGRLLHVYNGGGLSFDVAVDRALDIVRCSYNGLALNWTSTAGMVHPAHYEAEGVGWLRTFQGGLLTTCGLDTFGSASNDEGEQLSIHGRVGNLPASQVAHGTYWDGDDYWLEISGQVQQTRLFGENLLLERRIRTKAGTSWIELDDSVTNLGFKPQPHMLLYHCNFGFPLIDADTQLHINTTQTIPRDDEAKSGLDMWSHCQPPTPDYEEQVFLHHPVPDKAGMTSVRVDNPALDFDLTISFSQATLPYVFQWKCMMQGAYVIGIEPSNCSVINGRAAAREADALPYLEPGESRSYSVRFSVD